MAWIFTSVMDRKLLYLSVWVHTLDLIIFVNKVCNVRKYRYDAPRVLCTKAPPHHRPHAAPSLFEIIAYVINLFYLLIQISPASHQFSQRQRHTHAVPNHPYTFLFLFLPASYGDTPVSHISIHQKCCSKVWSSGRWRLPRRCLCRRTW